VTAGGLLDLAGKVAVITGGSRAPGRQMALAFAGRTTGAVIEVAGGLGYLAA
jgi:NAD(P)-dependent dehydrogenase (short-subunit alcohol dehydrogenase family)